MGLGDDFLGCPNVTGFGGLGLSAGTWEVSFGKDALRRGSAVAGGEWLYREDIRDGLELVAAVRAYRQDYNHTRPHEALAWNRPADVHTGRAARDTPTFQSKENLPTT